MKESDGGVTWRRDAVDQDDIEPAVPVHVREAATATHGLGISLLPPRPVGVPPAKCHTLGDIHEAGERSNRPHRAISRGWTTVGGSVGETTGRKQCREAQSMLSHQRSL